MPGVGSMMFFLMTRDKFTEHFTIEESSCAVRQIYGESSAKTQLLRSVRDNLLKTTPEGRELIKLYYQWSPVIVKAMEADEDFKEEVKETIELFLPMMREGKN